jgi:hypothetical protein
MSVAEQWGEAVETIAQAWRVEPGKYPEGSEMPEYPVSDQ